MTCSTIVDRRPRIEDRIQRIANFLGRQDNFTHALIVWYGNQKFLCQVGPDPTAAFDMLNAALDGMRWDSDDERVEANFVPAQLTRLNNQVLACIRSLGSLGRNSINFVLAWRIAGDESHVDHSAGLPHGTVWKALIASFDHATPVKPDLPALASAN